MQVGYVKCSFRGEAAARSQQLINCFISTILPGRCLLTLVLFRLLNQWSLQWLSHLGHLKNFLCDFWATVCKTVRPGNVELDGEPALP